MLQGIEKRIREAEHFQTRVNQDLDYKWRDRAFVSHNDAMNRMMTKHAVDCLCMDCLCVLDRFHGIDDPCPHCGGRDIASPYWA